MKAELETLVLPGVEQDPRAHYIDYTRATDWEETVATLEDRLPRSSLREDRLPRR